MRPVETRYARNGDIHIAYQVIGQGSFDLVFVPGFVSNLEIFWEDSGFVHLVERLSAFSRLILFDKRGTGLSDRFNSNDPPSLAAQLDDMLAVLNAAGSGRTALLGEADGAAIAVLFATAHPQRTRALVLFGGYAHFHSSVLPPELFAEFLRKLDASWGRGIMLPRFSATRTDDQRFSAWWGRFERLSASPSSAMTLARINAGIDVRDRLPKVQAPTRVIHRMDDIHVAAEGGRYLAANIPGATFTGLPGNDHPIWMGDGDIDRIADTIEEFLTGERRAVSGERVLVALLVVQVLAPRQMPTGINDHRWREQLENFRELAANLFALHSGHVVSWEPEKIIIRFDGTARAAQCALALRDFAGVSPLRLAQGLHAGEIEASADLVTGFAIHVAEHVAAAAQSGAVLVSSVVAELAVGSSLRFTEHCAIDIDGLDAPVRLFTVAAEQHLEPARTHKDEPSLDALTIREREVLSLVADGMSNAAIASRLDLSEHTIKRHVANMLLKLDLPTRTAAAAFSARHAKD